jgi:CRP-like cAMP-binding protein
MIASDFNNSLSDIRHIIIDQPDIGAGAFMKFRNLLLSSMPQVDLARLFPAMHEISLRASEPVHEVGEPVRSVIFPSSAVLSAVTIMRDGASVETATIGHEGAAGLISALSDSPSTNRVFAQIPGGAVRLPAANLRSAAMESPQLMTLLLRTAQASTAEAQQSVACNALHDAPARLARWLLLTQDRTGGSTFPLTQDYMAIMVGVQRTTISAIASDLKARGLVHYSRGLMEIRDRAGLEAASCECYEAMRARYAALGAPQPGADGGGD